MKIIEPIVFSSTGFTRASEATYYDEDGILTTAEVDELRLGYDPTTLDFIGPIIEPAIINRFFYSNVFSNAVWTKTGVALTSELSIESPDGTTNATSSPGLGSISQTIDLPFGLNIVELSVFVRSGTFVELSISFAGSTTTCLFDITAASYHSYESFGAIQKLPNDWYRVSMFAGGVTSSVECLIDFQSPAGMLVYGAQAETTSPSSSRATSYIESDSSNGVRAADIQSDNAVLAYSNVAENDHPVWNSGASYVAGNQVIVLGNYHRVYESVGSNTNKFPPDFSSLSVPEDNEWIDQGSTNRWRMFDMAVGAEKQTVSDGGENLIRVHLYINQPINSVALLNMNGANVRVVMRDSLGNIVYNFYKELSGSIYESDWWSFFFGARYATSSIVLTNLPPYQPAIIEMTLDGLTAAAKIGKMIVGNAIDIGCTRYGAGVGILDFSRKQRDDFGNNFILGRRYVDRADFDIQILTSRVDEVKQLLASLRATAVLYVGDENFTSTIIYGFYRDFSIVISGPKRSDATLQIEGI